MGCAEVVYAIRDKCSAKKNRKACFLVCLFYLNAKWNHKSCFNSSSGLKLHGFYSNVLAILGHFLKSGHILKQKWQLVRNFKRSYGIWKFTRIRSHKSQTMKLFSLHELVHVHESSSEWACLGFNFSTCLSPYMEVFKQEEEGHWQFEKVCT